MLIKSFDITPNPFHKSNPVRIDVGIPNCSKNPKEMIILDILGKVITSRTLNEGKNVFLINGSDLNNNKVCRCNIVIGSQIAASKNLVMLE